jgi:mannose-1-phosphate guanylyltransferase
MIHLELSISNACAVAQLSGGRLESDCYGRILSARTEAADSGARTLLLDFAGVKAVAASGIGALVELASLPQGPDLMLCGLSQDALKRLRSLGLLNSFAICKDRATALASPAIQRHRVAGLRAVILADHPALSGGRTAVKMPVATLDILGRSLLRRNLHHLSRAGVRDAIIVAGPHGPAISQALVADPVGNISVFLATGYLPGSSVPGSSVPGSSVPGSAGALAQLRAEGNLGGDTLVIDGSGLTDVDIAALYRTHSSSGADITVVASVGLPSQGRGAQIIKAGRSGRITAFSSDHPGVTYEAAGACIVGARGLGLLARSGMRDVFADLLPLALDKGLSLQIHEQGRGQGRITTLHDYADLLSRALCGRIADLRPVGQEVRGGLWIAPGAVIGAGAALHGPCYVGAGARIGAGAEVHGPTVIGADVVIGDASFVGASIVLPQTVLAPGTALDQTIAGSGWVVTKLAPQEPTASTQTVPPVLQPSVAAQAAFAGGRA